MIKGIKFVNIPVRDQARALAFYTETLGCSVATNQPMGPTGQRRLASSSSVFPRSVFR
jgi:catechol 2,3-dioxygenase-like lactoylglutathione lyase family enzyme